LAHFKGQTSGIGLAPDIAQGPSCSMTDLVQVRTYVYNDYMMVDSLLPGNRSQPDFRFETFRCPFGVLYEKVIPFPESQVSGEDLVSRLKRGLQGQLNITEERQNGHVQYELQPTPLQDGLMFKVLVNGRSIVPGSDLCSDVRLQVIDEKGVADQQIVAEALSQAFHDVVISMYD